MPQLVKGGKYVFGWSSVKKNGEIKIPNEAFLEYRFFNDRKGILITGSKTSGGFGLSSVRLLKNSKISEEIEKFPELINFKVAEGEIVKKANKKFCWVKISKEKSIKLPYSTLKNYDCDYTTKFLVVRGSGIALGFITQGPIYNEAKTHLDILSI